MIHQVVLALLDPLRRTKVHSILLTNIFDLFPGSCEADYRGMEFREVGLQDARCVSCWVAGYEEREDGRERGRGLGGEEGRGVYEVNHLGHFVELFGTDVWAVGEAEIYL